MAVRNIVIALILMAWSPLVRGGDVLTMPLPPVASSPAANIARVAAAMQAQLRTTSPLHVTLVGNGLDALDRYARGRRAPRNQSGLNASTPGQGPRVRAGAFLSSYQGPWGWWGGPFWITSVCCGPPPPRSVCGIGRVTGFAAGY